MMDSVDAQPVVNRLLYIAGEDRLLRDTRRANRAMKDYHSDAIENARRHVKEVQMTEFGNIALTSSDDDKIADAIGKATRHAQRVSRRDHLKADRIERVNQFVVSLRREIMLKFSGPQSSAMVDGLCNKELWYDAGEPSPSFSWKFQGPTIQQIEKWVRTAKRMSSNYDAQSELIQADLEELERSLHGFQIQVEEAERINTEGDVILDGLEKLFA